MGNEIIYGKLYKKHKKRVLREINKFGFSHWRTDELCQDTFLKGWNNFDSLKSIEAFPAWICSIARFTCIDEIKKKKICYVGDQVDLIENIPDHSQCSDNYTSELVRETFKNSGNTNRSKVAKMFYLEEKTALVISNELGMNKNTVLSHLRRFRMEFAKILSENHQKVAI